MAGHHARGIEGLRQVVGRLQRAAVHVADATTFIRIPTPDRVRDIAPHAVEFHIEQVVRADRPACLATIVRARRTGTAEVTIRMLPAGDPVLLTVVDLSDDLGAVALVLSQATDAAPPAPSVRPAGDGMVTLDGLGQIVQADAVARLMLLVKGPIVGTSMLEIIHEDDRDAAMIAFGELLGTEDGLARHRLRLRTPTGFRWTSLVARPRRDGAGIVCSLLDVHDELGALEALRESEERFRSLAESIPIGVFHVDRDGRVLYANEEFRRITGLSPGETDPMRIVVPEHVDRTDAAIDAFTHAEGVLELMSGIRRKDDGVERTVRVVARALRDDTGHAAEIVGSVEDVTERVALEEQLVHEATRDALTGLANRGAFLRAAEERLAARSPGQELAVLFIDLDGFKALNDTAGHRTGDEVLAAIAARLQVSLRPADLIGRIGGDEFVIVTDVEGGPDGVLALAHRLRREVGEPISVGSNAVRVRASVGVALSRPPDREFGGLLRAADLAMYEAKTSEGGGVRLIDDRLLALGERRIQLEGDLPAAVRNGELRVEYQPVVSLDNHMTTGAEALLRWEHPTLGRVPPSEFIPVAEELGVIHELGHWLIHRALGDLRLIRSADPSLAGFLVGINLSARQLGARGFPAWLLGALDEHGLGPDDLVVELTETILMDATPHAEEHIRQLADAGVTVSLDDFGSGTSSIDHLTRLPAQGLKLDMSFTHRLPESSRTCAVAQGLGVLCRQLGVDLIAEGVETVELLDLVTRLGVTHVQGYLLARPAPVDQLVAHLLAHPDLVTAGVAAATTAAAIG